MPLEMRSLRSTLLKFLFNLKFIYFTRRVANPFFPLLYKINAPIMSFGTLYLFFFNLTDASRGTERVNIRNVKCIPFYIATG